VKVCPRCKRKFDRLLALSRKDNKTHICDECGIQEALEAYAQAGKQKTQRKLLKKDERERICNKYYPKCDKCSLSMRLNNVTLCYADLKYIENQMKKWWNEEVEE